MIPVNVFLTTLYLFKSAYPYCKTVITGKSVPVFSTVLQLSMVMVLWSQLSIEVFYLFNFSSPV